MNNILHECVNHYCENCEQRLLTEKSVSWKYSLGMALLIFSPLVVFTVWLHFSQTPECKLVGDNVFIQKNI